MSQAIAPGEPGRSGPTWTAIGFVGFLAVYVTATTALRGQFDVRYDDTTVVQHHLRGLSEGADRAAHISRNLCSREYWATLFTSGFDSAGVADGARPEAYRPLQSAYNVFATWAYFRFGPPVAYLLCFLLLGMSGYLIFRFFQEVGPAPLAAICTAAYLFFPAVVAPAWVPLAGPQSMIPGAYAAALLAYLRYLRTGRKRQLLIIALVCVVGPLFKETIGIAALLLLAHQLFAAPTKRWGLIAGLVVASVHGIFPSAAIGLALTGQLHLISIFSRGSLHDHAIARSWRPEFLMDLVAFFPPTLLLVSLVSIAVCTYTRRPVARFALPTRLTRYALPLCRGAAFLLATVAIGCLLALIVGRPVAGTARTALLTLAAIALYGFLYVDILTAGWFCCLFLPLMRIYFNSTQCGYVAAPLIYLCVAPLFHCWEILATRKGVVPLQAALRYALVAVGLVAFCDNALSIPNAWVAYRATGHFNDAIVPSDLRVTLQRPDAGYEWRFISNTVVADDAAILSTKFRVGSASHNSARGVPPPRVIMTREDLQAILSTHQCALLVAEHCNPLQANYWEPRDIEKLFRPIGEQRVDFQAYYADPLRRRIDNRDRSMMGPPDFQNEFVRDTRWFRERFSNHYRILVRNKGPADLTDFVTTATELERTPILALANVRGFNIIACDHKFYGLPFSGGAFDLKKARDHQYAVCFEGTSVEQVKHLIDEYHPTVAKGTNVNIATPILAVADVHGFNIIACDHKFYGLPFSGGAFDLKKARERRYAVCFEGTSIEQVKHMIEQAALREPIEPPRSRF